MVAAVGRDLVAGIDDRGALLGEGLQCVGRGAPRRADVVTGEELEQSGDTDFGAELASREVRRRGHSEGAHPQAVCVEVGADGHSESLSRWQGERHQVASHPPSTQMTWPVM